LARLSQDGGLAASRRSSTDCCTWDGVACNAIREVIEVSLSGSLPLELMLSSSMCTSMREERRREKGEEEHGRGGDARTDRFASNRLGSGAK